MRQHLALATWSALAGCSLIYNPNNLPNAPAEAGIDAPSDAEVILDADPTMLKLIDVAPSTINEGQGDGGSKPALIVIRGMQIVDSSTVVDITPVGRSLQLTLGTPVIARNGNWIAIEVTALVDVGLTKGDAIPLDVKVTQTIPPGLGSGLKTDTLHGKLTLVGLKELTQATTPEVTGSNIDTTKLEPLYSQVDLSTIPGGTASFVGTERAVIHAVASITASKLSATPITVPVAGGCGGGTPGADSNCGSTGGHGGGPDAALSSAGGGGGGGFSAKGTDGGPKVAGAGGGPSGDELIVAYVGFAGGTPNLGGGGGGGGTPSVLGGAGGAGGASGGTIELTAGGNLSVGDITADGAKGAPGAGGVSGGGGGGGGAGGVVMLRTGAALAATGTISVAGKAGGSGGGGTTAGGAGGTGADGRVRWDAATGGAPTSPVGTLHRGPTFTLATRIFRVPSAAISLSGTANDRFAVYVMHDGNPSAGAQGLTFGTQGTAIFSQTLQQGYSLVCITLEGGKQASNEASKCVEVAFLP